MSKRIEIPAEKFRTDICKLWSKDWLLLTAGNRDDFNAMTVGWGSIGTMWGKPFAMIVVRPQRHTIGYLEKGADFTLTAFPEAYRSALQFCGSKSGRDVPCKAVAAGLTPIVSAQVASPGYEEAELIIECKKSFKSYMKAEQFLNPDDIKNWYPAEDFHEIYFGEIVRISGTEKYLAKD